MNVLRDGYINLIESMGDDLRIVNAARKSFANESKEFTEKDRTLLKYLWDNDHTSPFEMVEFLFEIKAPLFVVRQWQRHRSWSYWSVNEVSRRYTSKNLDFYYPNEWRRQAEDNKQSSEGKFKFSMSQKFDYTLWDLVDYCVKVYKELLKRGLCREQARMVLPQNMMVEFVGKVDLKNLMDFLRLRLHPHAQWEIQEYARAIVELITPVVPETMKLFKEKYNVGDNSL